MFNQFRCQLAKLISPGASLPVAGNLPQVQIVAPPVPSAIGGPGQLIRGNPQDMDDVIKAVATLRRAGLTGKKAVAARPGPVGAAPRAIAPASDDATQKSEPVDYSDIIKTLEGIVTDLKSKVPVDASDESDEASARAAAKSGRTSDAVNRFSALALKLQAKVTAKKSVNPLLAEKSSPQRAHKLTASGFNADPVVAALNAQLGRAGSLNLADRAGMTLAAVGGTRTPAPPTAVTPRSRVPIDGTVYRSLRAERAKLNEKARKDFCFDQKFRAEDARLKAAIDHEIQKTRPQ